MKKIITFGALALTLCATSCSTDETVGNEANNDGKEIIQFAAGDSQVLTSRAGFAADTRIVARFVSDERGGSETKCVKTVMTAAAEASSAGYSNVTYVNGKTRYWDDAHGRKSILSVYAIAVPGDVETLKETVLKGADTWGTNNAADNTLTWTVTADQTEALLNAEDLTYSNNIQSDDVGAKGVYTWNYSTGSYPEYTPSNAIKHTVNSNTDGRMYFTQADVALTDEPSDAAGHYDRGQMEFRHALSRIQVNLIKGEGYSTFTNVTVKALSQVASGTFDIKTAAWSNKSDATAITMAKKEIAAASKDATFEAQMLPGYTFEDNTGRAIELTVDGNTYIITKTQLRAALNGETGVNAGFSTEMGKRYVFDITVAKTKIQNITATVLNWVDVTGANIPMDNSHVKFTFLSPSGTSCGIDDINFYRYGQNLGQVYTDNTYEAPATAASGKAFEGPAELSGTGTFETNWYYEDNKTAYHFRTLNNAAKDKVNSGQNAFTMTAASSVDYHWGAPMASTPVYSFENGFVANIDKGVVSATEDTELKIQEIHMMSNIIVKLKSNPETGAAAIDLSDAEVTITDLYTGASVDMGTGKITTTGDLGNNVMTAADEGKTHTFSVIPQILDRTSGDKRYVGITIKVAGSEYHIVEELKTIKDASNKAITEWLPGHTYTYTFTLSKKKIEVITATIAEWIPVNGENVNIGLEK